MASTTLPASAWGIEPHPLKKGGAVVGNLNVQLSGHTNNHYCPPPAALLLLVWCRAAIRSLPCSSTAANTAAIKMF